MPLVDIKFPDFGQLLSTLLTWVSKDRRKVVPYSEVRVGTYVTDRLKVDILAAIVLSDPAQPDVNLFLKRLTIEKPYCARCARPLDELRLSWKVDFAQVGYNCPNCQTEITKDPSDLRKDVHAEVRRAYDSYWRTYRDAIVALTKGKPHKYRLP